MRITRLLALSGVLALGGAGLMGAGPARADVTEKEVTETTTFRGTVTDLDPGTSTFVLRSESSTAPTRYTYTKTTTFLDSQGNVVARESVRGNPVTVYYTKRGDDVIVDRVVVSRPQGSVIERRESTKEIVR